MNKPVIKRYPAQVPYCSGVDPVISMLLDIGGSHEPCPETIIWAAKQAIRKWPKDVPEALEVGGGFNWSSGAVVFTENMFLRVLREKHTENSLLYSAKYFDKWEFTRLFLHTPALFWLMIELGARHRDAFPCTFVADQPCKGIRMMEIPGGCWAIHRESTHGRGGGNQYTLYWREE